MCSGPQISVRSTGPENPFVQIFFVFSGPSYDLLFAELQVKSKATGAVYIVAESRLSQLPSPKKAKTETPKTAATHSTETIAKGSAKKGDKKGDKNGHKGEAAPSEADTSAYDVLSRCKGADLVDKK